MNSVSSVLRFLLRLLFSVFLLLVILIGLQYTTTTIYEFEDPKRFSGEHWLNPYQVIDSACIKANFHAHTCVWNSMTYGRNTSRKMRECYKQKKYDIASISDYFSIDTTGRKEPLYVPVYEHGFNIFKTHCLAIDAPKVNYTDYFLFQSTSHQQKVIEEIKAQKGIVAIAHPDLSMGRSLNDMKYLVHYDLFEVLNHFRISERYWDAALSAGKLSYLVANDDSHSTDEDETGRVWTVIFSGKKSRKDVLGALLKGKAFGVYTVFNNKENDLVSCQVENKTISVRFIYQADTILFIGQDGVVKQKVFNVANATYELKADDTYIRVVAKNALSSLYLNPIVRYDSQIPLNSLNVPKEKMLQTWLFRAFVIGIIYFPFRWLWRIWRPKRKKKELA